MYKLTTIAELLKRVRRKPELAACAIAALLFLAALPGQVRAQNTYGGLTVVYDGIIELAPRQTVLVAVPNFYFDAGSVKAFKYAEVSVHVLDHAVTERTSNLVYSGESGVPIRYEDLMIPGAPATDSIQLWIEVKLVLDESTQKNGDDRSVDVPAPTLELVELSGTTASNAAGRSVSISLRARPELSPTVSEIK